MNILHVTSHLGGGVGKILSSISVRDKANEHKIFSLQETKTTKFLDICHKNKIEVINDWVEGRKLAENWADIVQLEWWHNPVTMKFMAEELETISCRLLVWSHISGCNFPYISPEFVRFPDKFLFSSQYSTHNPFWTIAEQKEVEEKASVVLSSGVNQVEVLEKVNHNGFHVGYLGNISYNKTYEKTVEYYESLAEEVRNIKFFIAGDVEYGKDFVTDLNASKVSDKVHFSGYVTDIVAEFSRYDVMSYLLKSDNFATAENALLEGMAFGVPPIVFRQSSEQFVVEHGKTGFLVENKAEYVECMKNLAANESLRKEISQNASRYIGENASIQATVEKLQKIYEELSSVAKSEHSVKKVFGSTVKEWFYTGYKGDKEKVVGNAAGENSSGLGQWKSYYGDFC